MATARAGGKSAAAFRTISEVSGELDVPQHVLRFWESKFNQVRPLKRAGGRRYYRPEDIALLRRIRDLLYAEGYTIKGVQRLLRDGGVKPAAATTGRASDAPAAPPAPASSVGLTAEQRSELKAIVKDLEGIRSDLKGSSG